MYENETFEVILRRMLGRILAKVDKREGSFIYDALAAPSVEFQNIYIALDYVMKEMFPDTASREFLIRHCADSGLIPKPASYAKVRGRFTPSSLEIPIGKRFSHEDLNYVVTEKISDGLYYLQCETIGSEPNTVTGQLIPIDYIDGLQTAEIVDVSILGEDEEETETLRERYFASKHSDAFGGNQRDYKQKILSIAGVGGVKEYGGSKWNGGGTVKCVIQDSDYDVPTFELVEMVQHDIDPEIQTVDIKGDVAFGANAGEGKGTAPIGHFVTVVGVNSTVVDIETVLTYKSGYSWDSVKDKVVAAVDAYFKDLNKDWQDNDKIRVRISQLESKLLNITGVLDVQQTTLNGMPENLAVDEDSIVTRGTINGHS